MIRRVAAIWEGRLKRRSMRGLLGALLMLLAAEPVFHPAASLRAGYLLPSSGASDPLDDADREAAGGGSDLPRALEVYLQASPASPRASQRLGYLYSHGVGVVANEPTALSYYRLAADAGDRLAMNNLGHAYEAGLGVAIDFTEARSWYERAAALGEPRAMTNLGYLCSHALGCPRSVPQAMDWYRKAAAMGEPVASYNLGRLLARPDLNNDQRYADKAFHEGLDHGDPLCDFGLSLNALLTPGGAEARAASTQLHAALQYSFGLQDRVALRLLAEQDAALSQRLIWNAEDLKLLSEAARQGDGPAMRHLAEAAAVKDGDAAAAMEFYKNAAIHDDVQSIMVVADAFASGNLLPKDIQQASVWYQRAADAGQREAYGALGKIYDTGVVSSTVDAARRYYMLGAEAGDATCSYRLTRLNAEGRGSHELPMDSPLLRRASTSDLAITLYEIGHDKEAAGAVADSTATAVTSYEQAVEAGSVPALIRLGDLYAAGQIVKHDDVQALEYYMRAARMGPRWASAVAMRLSLSDNRSVASEFRKFIDGQLAPGAPASAPSTAP